MAFEGSQITRSVTRVSGFRDVEFDYQLLRAMGTADYGGSTVGECLAAAGELHTMTPPQMVTHVQANANRMEYVADNAINPWVLGALT